MIIKFFLFALLSLGLSGCGAPGPEPSPAPVPPRSRSVTLVFAGDVMQHLPQVNAAYDPVSGRHEYRSCFALMEPLWKGADFVLANLETTLDDRGYRGYPLFVSPRSLAEDLQKAGINVLVTANNHCCDNGRRGIEKTLEVLDSLGLVHVGTYADSAERAVRCPAWLKKDGFSIALLNYTYGTNGNPVPEGNVVDRIDTLRIGRDIAKARAGFATQIVVFIHWGNEYESAPSPEQRRLARWLHERGADLVVGSHPHVVQPIEAGPDGRLTAYSLGNFVSNQRRPRTDGGISLKVTVTRGPDGKYGYESRYGNQWVWTPTVNGRKTYLVVPEGAADSVLRTASASERAAFDRLMRLNDETAGDGVKKLEKWN